MLPLFLCLFSHFFKTFNFQSNFACTVNEFILEGISDCHPLFTCKDVNQMKPIKLLASGIVKNIWLVEWQSQNIVMSKLRDQYFAEDFNANLDNMQFFKASNYVTNWLGNCGNAIFTQYYPHGNALNLHLLYDSYKITSFKNRFHLCVNYAQIISLLHNHSMVMCDSNSVAKTLTQFLITNQFEIILNDMDALPRLDKFKLATKCGHHQIIGDLVAPEQQWPYQDKYYNHSLMPFYNEKVDIWKLPDICQWILGDVFVPEMALKMLHFIHRKCKLIDHTHRPSANEIVRFYNLIINYFV